MNFPPPYFMFFYTSSGTGAPTGQTYLCHTIQRAI